MSEVPIGFFIGLYLRLIIILVLSAIALWKAKKYKGFWLVSTILILNLILEALGVTANTGVISLVNYLIPIGFLIYFYFKEPTTN